MMDRPMFRKKVETLTKDERTITDIMLMRYAVEVAWTVVKDAFGDDAKPEHACALVATIIGLNEIP